MIVDFIKKKNNYYLDQDFQYITSFLRDNIDLLDSYKFDELYAEFSSRIHAASQAYNDFDIDINYLTYLLVNVNSEPLEHMATVYDYMFANLSIYRIFIPSNIEKISHNAFYGCTNLEQVTFDYPCNLIYIGRSAFQNCSSLRQLDLSPCNNLTTIMGYAFEGCTSLKSIVLPSSLKEIPYNIFNNCPNLDKIYYDGTKEDIDNLNINNNDKNSIRSRMIALKN